MDALLDTQTCVPAAALGLGRILLINPNLLLET